MKISFFFLTFAFSAVLAAPPTLTDSARKESKSDSEVIKEDIDKMKEDVLNKKTQLMLFHQLLKSEAIESTFPIVTITHVNEMSSRYKIFSLTYLVDDDRVFTFYSDSNTGKQNFGRETKIFKGPLVPGVHELKIDVVYQGNDTGIFSYINDYKIPTESKRSFKVDKGQNVAVQVVGYEKGWALTDFKDRPDLKVKINGSNQSKELK